MINKEDNMKRVVLSVVIGILVLMILTGGVGCKDVDWKDVSKNVAAHFIANLVRDTFDRYSSEEYKATSCAWVMEQLGKIEWFEPYMKAFNVESLVDYTWDYLWVNIYKVAEGNGMDVNADELEAFGMYANSTDFPELTDRLVGMME